MGDLIKIIQLVIAFSVIYVWIFRFHNVLKEFTAFNLSDVVRNFVGASKIALATLLITGVWYPNLVLVSASLMGVFMIAAQFFHFKIGNPFKQRIPSLMLLILCGSVVYLSI